MCIWWACWHNYVSFPLHGRNLQSAKFSSKWGAVQFSRSVVSDSLWPHKLLHARLPCPSPTPEAYSNSCPLSRWCHPAILSSVIPFSACLQSFPATGSLPVSQFFTSGDQIIGFTATASVLTMNIQDGLVRSHCSPRDSQESFLTSQFKSWLDLITVQGSLKSLF